MWYEMRKIIRQMLPVLFIIVGLSLLFYPFISDYINSRNADGVIKTYQQDVEQLDTEEKEEMLEAARSYNQELINGHAELTDPFDPDAVSNYSEDYGSLLSTNGSEVMAYLEIPKIDVYLPIYHGTSDEVLQTAVGHLEGSSLPIGGESTHVVLSGHTGLRNARIFTDLTELVEGDFFYIYVLGDTLAYQVDQILIVEPEDISDLYIVEGEDYVTLVTCTPYGVNSQRLLVRGTRVEYVESATEEEEAQESTTFSGWDSQWMRQYRRALLAGIIILIAVILILRVVRRFFPGRRERNDD